MKRRLSVLIALAGIAAAVFALASVGHAQVAGAAVDKPPKACEAGGQSPDFAYFEAGQAVDGIPLVNARRVCDPAPNDRGGRRNFVSYIYGECHLNGADACASPLEIQTWPACERYRDKYRLDPAGDPLPRVDDRVRGVPAAWFEGGDRLELYTDKSTIVIFGQDQKLMRAAARMLARGPSSRGRASTKGGDDLPAPAPGGLDGALPCSAAQ